VRVYLSDARDFKYPTPFLYQHTDACYIYQIKKNSSDSYTIQSNMHYNARSVMTKINIDQNV